MAFELRRGDPKDECAAVCVEGGNRDGRAGDKSQGTVKWFNEQGVWLHCGGGGGPDVFVHYSAIAGAGRRNLREGQRVEFEIIQEATSPRAANVTPLE